MSQEKPPNPPLEDLSEELLLRFLDDPHAAAEAALSSDGPPQHLAALDLLAALPEGLEPAQASAEGRQRLLAAAAQQVAGQQSTARSGAEQQRSNVSTFRPGPRQPQATAGDGPGESPAALQRPEARSAAPRWVLPLAAALVAAVVILGFTTWNLNLQVLEQSRTVAQLTSALQQQDSTKVMPMTLPASHRDNLEELQRSFSMITDVAAQLYPLRPPGEPVSLETRGQRGVIYVCSFHQQWYVNLHGLPAAPADQRYVLWFQTPEGPVPAAEIDVQSGIPAEMQAHAMPEGTTGFLVTLEPEASHQPMDAQRDGPVVLESLDSVLL
ncbi:MAG: anti-sigma factor [Acidobacteriota bacterium]